MVSITFSFQEQTSRWNFFLNIPDFLLYSGLSWVIALYWLIEQDEHCAFDIQEDTQTGSVVIYMGKMKLRAVIGLPMVSPNTGRSPWRVWKLQFIAGLWCELVDLNLSAFLGSFSFLGHEQPCWALWHLLAPSCLAGLCVLEIFPG